MIGQLIWLDSMKSGHATVGILMIILLQYCRFDKQE